MLKEKDSLTGLSISRKGKQLALELSLRPRNLWTTEQGYRRLWRRDPVPPEMPQGPSLVLQVPGPQKTVHQVPSGLFHIKIQCDLRKELLSISVPHTPQHPEPSKICHWHRFYTLFIHFSMSDTPVARI